MVIENFENQLKYNLGNAQYILGEYGYIVFSKGAYAKVISNKCFSNFYPIDINIKGKIFTCSEQIFMAYKAKYFGSNEILEKILNLEYNPYKYKSLGNSRKIPYNDDEWKKVRVYFMYKSLKFKFDKNIELKNFLLNTGNALLIECNPGDKYWACGLSEEQFFDKRFKFISNWNGENLLGFLLMELRDEYKSSI